MESAHTSFSAKIGEDMAFKDFKAMWSYSYVVLFLFEFFAQMGAQTSIPIVSNYAIALGATVAMAGLLASLNSVTALVLRFFAGPLFNRFSIKKLFIVFSIVFSFSCLTCGYIQDLVVLAVCRLIFGVALVGKTTLIIVLAAQILPESTRGQGVAWLALTNVFAIAICPLICSFIGPLYGWNTLFYMAGAFFLLAIVCSFLIKVKPVGIIKTPGQLPISESGATSESMEEIPSSDKPAHMKTPKRKLTWRSFIYVKSLPICLIGLLEAFAYGMITTLTLTVGELRGIEEISLFFISYVIVSFAARPVSGKLYDKYGFKRLGAVLALFIVASMIVFAYAYSVIPIMISGALFAIGQGCLWPCLQAESVKDVPKESYSLSANTMLFGVDAGCSLGPIVCSAIMDATSPTIMFWFVAGIAFLLFLAILWYNRRKAA